MTEKKIPDCLQVYTGTPKGRNSSVHYSKIRFDKAWEESTRKPVPIKNIIEIVNSFLSSLNIAKVDNPIMTLNGGNINYDLIKVNNNLLDKRDIVWMKFTQDAFLGVVATSNDINFDIPQEASAYNDKKKNKWVYTTSGIIIHHLKKKWNENFVLVFPLQNIPKNLNRHDIERGVGNYLIYRGVPILDFYSHNY